MTTESDQYIVFDTNVIISAALFPRSTSARALTLAMTHFQLAQTEATWEEFQKSFARSKFDGYLRDEGRTYFSIRIAQRMSLIQSHTTVTDCRDPKDNKFLALAIDAGAKTIVTGDKDLLVMHPYQGITICTPSEFLSHQPADR